jgi:hypothetical protein
MSVEGIWTSEILGLFGWETTGILICENGRAIDGGNHHYSVGSYETSGDQIHIALSVEYHSTPRTIFGASDKTLKVEINGTVENDIIMGTAYRADRPDQKVTCKLTRRMDLPAT